MKIFSHFYLIASVSIFFTLLVICEQSFAAESKNNSLSEDILIQKALKAYDVKNYTEAFYLFQKATPHDNTGVSQELVGIIDSKRNNYNSAIHSYKIALKKMQESGTLASIPETIDNLGIAYNHAGKHVNAFQCYKQAAKMGYSYAQYNLANYYEVGFGVIQNDIKAYAWYSVAIAEGLSDKDQSTAEKIQNELTKVLLSQGSLSQAKNLANHYYKLYVPHNSIQ